MKAVAFSIVKRDGGIEPSFDPITYVRDYNIIIEIPMANFYKGVGYLKYATTHEMGHYVSDVIFGDIGPINITKPGKEITSDGISELDFAIRYSGKFHVPFKPFVDSQYPLHKASWNRFNWKKWLYLLPQRFSGE